MNAEDANLEYLEQNLPSYLETSLSQMKELWESGGRRLGVSKMGQ